MSKNLTFSVLLDFYGGMLKDRQRQITEYYYNEDLSLAEISEIVGISRQGVRDALKKAETALIEFEDKLGIKKRFDEILVKTEEIKIMLSDLNPDDDISAQTEKIKLKLDDINF